MRKLLLLLAATVVLVGATTKRQIDAPSAEVFGTYTLVSVNDEELPYTDPEDGETVTDGSLNLRTDWSFAVSLTVLEGVQEPNTLTFLGTFTLDESNIMHFTVDGGDTAKGTWDGNDQITIMPEGEELTLIFRR